MGSSACEKLSVFSRSPYLNSIKIRPKFPPSSSHLTFPPKHNTLYQRFCAGATTKKSTFCQLDITK